MSFLTSSTALLVLASLSRHASAAVVEADGTSFALNGNEVSYRFHVDSAGDLIGDHFGGTAYETVSISDPKVDGWTGMPGRVRREFPDQGRGDFRTPAVRIRQSAGYTVSDFQYTSHEIVEGKPDLPGMPSLFGSNEDVTTLVVHLYDNYSSVAADLTYSIFPAFDTIVRSVSITNEGEGDITVEKLASFSVDMPYEELEMIELQGEWSRENRRTTRKVQYGTQGFGSATGYASHDHNPFLALQTPGTTETSGEAWGFSLVYTGSFAAEVEKSSQGFTRAMLGFNTNHLSYPLAPGQTLNSPEVVSVYSSTGVGGMSRKYHRLFRNHLVKSDVYRNATRPVLLNSWEGLFYDYNETTVENLATEAAALGVKLFVLDDGWFGKEYPRVIDNAGLGDWEVNPDKFPSGSLAPLAEAVTNLTAANSTEKLRFGLWVEPEMVNPDSTLYNEHPDWVLSAGPYPRTQRRNQLVLNVALPEVQEFIIESISNILRSTDISYVKWDNNRGVHELPSPDTDHNMILGLYKVFANLTSTFPDVLWEGCASGGGRFDPGVLAYFPQIWASDGTDALSRIYTQMGGSLVYPPSVMGAHISPIPNGQTSRTIPVAFRGHVAMMGGSFGLELNPIEPQTSEEDQAALPGLIALAERVGPLVHRGDFWRLQLPETSNWPAAMFIAEDGAEAVVFWFQVRSEWNIARPYLRLQGLDSTAKYLVDGNLTYSGATLMNVGLQQDFLGDYDSAVVFLQRQ